MCFNRCLIIIVKKCAIHMHDDDVLRLLGARVVNGKPALYSAHLFGVRRM